MNNRNLQLRESGNGVIYVTSDFFPSKYVVMGFSTRFGGISPEPYNTLNLGYSVEDTYENVRENRHRFVKALNRDLNKTVIGNQVHGDQLALVTEKALMDHEYLDNPEQGISDTDGLLTYTSGVTLLGSFADCVPLFFYEPNIPMVGLSHAGWRGACSEIARKTISKMMSYGGVLTDIKVIIGPSIGPCCYRVGDDVYQAWEKKVYRDEIFYGNFDNMYLDLWKANYLQLINTGIPSDNILLGNICTSCNKDIFFSYRNGGASTGRMMGLLSIK